MNTPPPRTRNRAGFTLMELLIALGIFAIGFIAVAAPLFVAARIQTQTVDEIHVQHATKSAQALMRGRPLSQSDLEDYYDQHGTTDFKEFGVVDLIPDVTPKGTRDRKGRRMFRLMPPLNDRSFPSTVADPMQRRYYWTLMVRDNNPAAGTYDFEVTMVMMRRNESATSVPAPVHQSLSRVDRPAARKEVLDLGSTNVLGTAPPFKVRPGDKILDEFGNIHTAANGVSKDKIPIEESVQKIAGADPTAFWYVPPTDNESPSQIRAIRRLSPEVVR